MAHKNRTAIFSDVRQVKTKTNFNFGTSLLKALILDQTNSTSSIAVSPVYVLCALAQLNLGAKGLTAKEITKIFGRDKSVKEIASYYGTTNFLKEKQQYSNSIYEAIKSACKANRYSLLREFRHLNGQYFGSGCQASFMTDETQTSNDDITTKASTSTDITSIASTFKTANVNFPDDIKNPVIKTRPSFYLVTKWPCFTVIEEPFYTSEGNSTQIAQMHGIQKFGYFECNRVKVLRIDIDKYEEVILGVILPKEQFGLDKLLRSIDGKTVKKWFENAAKTTKVKVQLPKFTTVSNHSNLDGALKSFGLESMFDKATADFSGMTLGHIWIEYFVQEAKVRIDGEKIEGAAVTPGLLGSLFPMKSFIADHPFLYVVVDKQGNLLVVGVFRGNQAFVPNISEI